MFDFRYELILDEKVYGKDSVNVTHRLDITQNESGYKAVLTPDRDVNKVGFRLRANVDYGTQRIYVNGYQSWTPSREYTVKDILKPLTPWCEFLDRFGHFKAYGDYNFCRYFDTPGYFHGFSYGYLRGDDRKIKLYGSLNERTGYTIIYHDAHNSEISFEKDLEGLSLKAGESYELMNLFFANDDYDAAFDAYFATLNCPKPRVAHRNGYTSWYNYYQNIKEDVIERDLESLAAFPVKPDIFQIDDGYQTAVGDWLSLDPQKFSNDLKVTVDKIHGKGLKAGLWLAPFGAQKISKVANEHPDWLVHDAEGKPLSAGGNWGGFFTLDMEKPAPRAYIKSCFDHVLNVWGFDMVKLDFLYQACMIPRNGKTRGQLMCEAMDFLRECVGDKYLLGCGVPLWPAFGTADYCRVGADVGLTWRDPMYLMRLHYEGVSTKYTVTNTIFRRHLDGRAFCNDPDVCLLRDNNIEISRKKRFLLGDINRIFGNILFVSDNIGIYDEEQRKKLTEIFSTQNVTEKWGEFIGENLIKISYVENGERKERIFNVKNGVEA